MRYLHSCLRYGAIGTDNLDKLIFRPAQISVCLDSVPPQAGEACRQQEINSPSGRRDGNLSQSTAGKVRSAGLFCGNTYDCEVVCLRIRFQVPLLNCQRSPLSSPFA